MQLTAAMRERNWEDAGRVEQAEFNPKRRGFPDPLDSRLECPLGRLRVKNEITQAEYEAGVKWHGVYSAFMHSIQQPDDLTEDECKSAAKAHFRGMEILERCGKRVLHAVNAIAVFEEPEELGDFEFTKAAARVGLNALAESF